eukprot:2423378-Rhodomonas_salina.1
MRSVKGTAYYEPQQTWYHRAAAQYRCAHSTDPKPRTGHPISPCRISVPSIASTVPKLSTRHRLADGTLRDGPMPAELLLPRDQLPKPVREEGGDGWREGGVEQGR